MLRRKSTNTSENIGVNFLLHSTCTAGSIKVSQGWMTCRVAPCGHCSERAPALGEVCLCWQSVQLFCTETLPTPTSLVHKPLPLTGRDWLSPKFMQKEPTAMFSDGTKNSPAWPLQCGQTYQRAEHSHPALRKPGSVQLSTTVSPKVASPRWTSGLVTSSILNRLALLYNTFIPPWQCTLHKNSATVVHVNLPEL